MSEITSRQIRLAARPEGRPGPEHFRLEEAAVLPPGEGEVLLQTLYLSLDPYMRGRMSAARSYAQPTELGAVMEGGTVSRVLESRDPRFAPGDIVLSYSGWQSHAVARGDSLRKLDPAVAPVSTALGVLGMPGFTAWSGLLLLGQPKAGETVVVAAATGPVGSAVGQIARIKGARAVGIAGGPKKCAALLEEFGFDAAIDHRAPDFPEQLRAACPRGIDVYFENVGGPVWDAVFPLLNEFARVPVCGLVSQYNVASTGGPDRLPGLMREVLSRSLTIRGFIQREFAAHRPEFLEEMAGWVAEGKVRYREDVVRGLEQAPEAFAGLLEGRNFGKLLVQVAE
ncbi:NADP-dependent oxidoreductase [Roseomonas marmotae]|uniref:NADP-dependent oxidoreductase n=1 Tax=Roseomonas marmotae TaxID=2768161 RepID=A0ABS3KED0_9PROT|nr:NADP-dependent oxidoreductase [Roseomonas marmotae]MBO1075826.1 NADP-dependent oxidoreductase [Roseomonas marmotae]QTI81980.1 NADP-dependent oxidoreductase [Roseomonas marmotae]